jgi:hypothetical protein
VGGLGLVDGSGLGLLDGGGLGLLDGSGLGLLDVGGRRRFGCRGFANSWVGSLVVVEGGPGLGGSRSILLKIDFALELGRIRISTGILRLDLLKIDCHWLDGLLDLGGSLLFNLVPGVVFVDRVVGLGLFSR